MCLDLDLDLFADECAAGINLDVEVEAEIATIDFTGGTESDTGAALRVGGHAFELKIELD